MQPCMAAVPLYACRHSGHGSKYLYIHLHMSLARLNRPQLHSGRCGRPAGLPGVFLSVPALHTAREWFSLIQMSAYVCSIAKPFGGVSQFDTLHVVLAVLWTVS